MKVLDEIHPMALNPAYIRGDIPKGKREIVTLVCPVVHTYKDCAVDTTYKFVESCEWGCECLGIPYRKRRCLIGKRVE